MWWLLFVVALPATVLTFLRTPLSPLAMITVSGDSMSPTLQPGDRVLVMRWTRPRRPGRLVVVDQPSRSDDRKWFWPAAPEKPRRLLVKRLAGIAPQGLIVLGDNAGASTDSREFGAVPEKHVYGIVWRRLLAAPEPPPKAGILLPPDGISTFTLRTPSTSDRDA